MSRSVCVPRWFCWGMFMGRQQCEGSGLCRHGHPFVWPVVVPWPYTGDRWILLGVAPLRAHGWGLFLISFLRLLFGVVVPSGTCRAEAWLCWGPS